MKSFKITVIPADGIGPDVVAAGLRALTAVAERDGGFRLEATEID